MATSLRRSKTQRIQPLASGHSIAFERNGLPSDDETVVYCMDCSSGAAFSPWSEHTVPTATSSWDEDFNTSATAQVQQTLEAIDGYLYEESDNEPGSSILNDELKLECERWKQQFPHLRVTGRRLASPTVTKSTIMNGGSTSTESKCNSETSWSAEDEMLKKKVIDHLCAIFWPEVQLWLELSHQHPAHDHLNLRQSHWDWDKEVHDCQQSLEGVLTVTPKLLSDRFSERACSSTTFSSRSSTAQSMLRQGSRQQWLSLAVMVVAPAKYLCLLCPADLTEQAVDLQCPNCPPIDPASLQSMVILSGVF
ncbi:hypothetical protein MTO96_019920 [Rhipicephalus appendiculatus]